MTDYGEAQRREDHTRAAKDAFKELFERGGYLREAAKVVVRSELDAQIGERRLEEIAERVIAGGWHAERRRLFLAGAEWARRQYGDASPPDGFYLAMEAQAEATAKGAAHV